MLTARRHFKMPRSLHSASLTLIVPHVAAHLEQARLQPHERWRTLELFAGRGEVSTSAVDSMSVTHLPQHAALLRAVQLDRQAQALPSAAVTRTGVEGEVAVGFWAHLEPVHFAAGLADLSAMRLRGSATLTMSERLQLEPLLRAHLQAQGVELSATDERWLMRWPRSLDVRTVQPGAAFSGPIDASMPTGPDAGELRRLMTELQMLVHEHPVNVRRASRSEPAVNAFWIWGTGIAPSPQMRSLPRAFGTDPYLQGLYRLCGGSTLGEAVRVEEVLPRTPGDSSDTVAMLEVRDLSQLESQWLVPVRRALACGVLSTFVLWLERCRIAVSARDLWRFWKRARPVTTWAA